MLLGSGVVLYLKSQPPAYIRVERSAVEKKNSIAPSIRININEAGAEELAELKGIGKSLAERIVAYRSSKGYFILKEDIKRVKGIGPALYEKLKDDITVE